VSPFSIVSDNASHVVVVIDSTLTSIKDHIAFHISPTETLFVTAEELRLYLQSMNVSITEVDFQAA
jgi:hypothetical protein